MIRYITRAWQDECRDGWQDRPSCEVFETNAAPVPIGIVDQHGVMICRVEDRVSLGFDLSKPRYRVKARSARA